ncbi:MAG: hypothetical protein D6698_11650 [Gammaproteobacteria bacterium]|nr:MAG: hypothetical protein D6698_11650 [Gammaproteobacteria bacterium]
MFSHKWHHQPPEDDDVGTAFRDVLFGVLSIFLISVTLLLIIPHRLSTGEVSNRANLQVMIEWDANRDIDIDLWGRAPDGSFVGYSTPSSESMDLMRDDLGFLSDPSKANFEVIFSRGIQEGWWEFTVHYYANRSGDHHPVVVQIYVFWKEDVSRRGASKKIIIPDVTLSKVGDEVTAVRLRFDKDGRLIEWNQQPTTIRGGGRSL